MNDETIINAIDGEALFEYLTAQYGNILCIWEDGTWSVQASNEVWPHGQGPVATARCPGIGNLDSTDFTEDFASWDEDREAYVVSDGPDQGRIIGDLEDVIRECVFDGDVDGFRNELINELVNE